MRTSILSPALGVLVGFAAGLFASNLAEASEFYRKQLTNSGEAETYTQSVVYDSRGIGHAVWTDAWQRLYHGRFDESGWLGEEIVAVGDYDWVSQPSICIDPTGQTIHLACVGWYGYSNTILYKRWNGAGWSPTEDISGGLGEHSPYIAADDEGNVIVVWRFDSHHIHNVYYVRWDGFSWTEPALLADDPLFEFHPIVVADMSNNFHALWTNGSGIWYKCWNGQSWTPDKVISSPVFGPWLSSIASAPDGTVRIVWSGGCHVYSKLWDGWAWQADEHLAGTAGCAYGAAIAADRNANWRVVWRDERHGDPEIYSRAWSEGEWGEQERLTHDGCRACPLSIAGGTREQWHVVWTDDVYDPTDWDVYYGRLEVTGGGVCNRLQRNASSKVRLVPNPTLGPCRVAFGASVDGPVSIEVVDILGRTIRHLLDGSHPAGQYEVVWDGKDDGGRRVSAGAYSTRVETVEGVSSTRVVLIK